MISNRLLWEHSFALVPVVIFLTSLVEENEENQATLELMQQEIHQEAHELQEMETATGIHP